MSVSKFTPAELEELRRADAEVDAADMPLDYGLDADHLGIPYNTLNQRFWRGWSAEKALTTPLKSRDFEATNYDI